MNIEQFIVSMREVAQFASHLDKNKMEFVLEQIDLFARSVVHTVSAGAGPAAVLKPGVSARFDCPNCGYRIDATMR